MSELQLSYPWLPADDNRSVVCCVCKNSDKERVVSTFDLNGVPYSIRCCDRDDLMFLAPQPGDSFLNALYNHPSYYTGEDDMYGMAMDEIKSREIAEVRVQEILKYAPQAKTLLEIGCAYGDVLEAAKKKGFTRAAGIEYSREAVERARRRGLDVREGGEMDSFEVFKGSTFDTVALYSVLEHTRDPYVFLSRAKELLAPGGLLVIRVPNTPFEGPHLSLLDHLWHFNESCLETIAKQLGYRVIDSFPSGVYKGLQHGGELRSITLLLQTV